MLASRLASSHSYRIQKVYLHNVSTSRPRQLLFNLKTLSMASSHKTHPNPRVGGCWCRPTKGAGRARPVNRGGGGWGEVAEYCKIFHPLGGKIAGFFPLCAKFPSLRPPPRPCCSNWIPSRLKKP